MAQHGSRISDKLHSGGMRHPHKTDLDLGKDISPTTPTGTGHGASNHRPAQETHMAHAQHRDPGVQHRHRQDGTVPPR
jgi:hypothetical protein